MASTPRRTIVLTGGTAGIGLHAAKKLSLGNRLIFAARSQTKGKALEASWRALGRDVTFLPLDMSKPESIRAFVQRLHKDLGVEVVDTLILNAGTSFAKEQRMGQELAGVEATLMVNHFGGHMLFRLLSPALRKSAAPRVVVVSSSGSDPDPKRSSWHPKVGNFDLDAAWDADKKQFRTTMLDGKSKFSGTRAYCDSKLLNVIFARTLARTHGDWLNAVSVHPGMVPSSDFPLYTGVFGFLARNVFPLMGVTNTLEQASQVIVEAALRTNLENGAFHSTSPEVKNEERFAQHPHNPEADDLKLQDKLWDIGEVLLANTGAKDASLA